MIRVLHVISSMNRGGAESFIMNLYRNINREKIQFDFLLHTSEESDYSNEINNLGGRIFSITPRNRGFLKNRNDITVFLNDHQEYKIIHQHVSSLSYITPLKISYKKNIPARILHSHSTREGGSKLHKFLHEFNKKIIEKYVTQNFACSDLAAEWVLNKEQFKKKGFRLIKNGIEINDYKYNLDNRKKMRKELNIVDNFVIGNIGNFVYPKNHTFLIDVFKKIYKNNKNAILLLVGDGILRKEIEEKVISENLSDNVIFTGKRTDIAHLLQAIDVFVMPSHFEGLPVTLIEAQTAGLPCIVSKNITNMVDITKNIEHISLESTPQYWAEKINDISFEFERIDTSSLIRKKGFDIKRVAIELEEFYLNC